MKKVKLFLLLTVSFLCVKSQGIYVPLTPTVYGVHQLRDKVDLVRHIPEKSSLELNTNDSSAQIFYYTEDSSMYMYTKYTGFKKLGAITSFLGLKDSLYFNSPLYTQQIFGHSNWYDIKADTSTSHPYALVTQHQLSIFSPSVNGIDDVLSVNQTITSDRQIAGGSRNILIDGFSEIKLKSNIPGWYSSEIQLNREEGLNLSLKNSSSTKISRLEILESGIRSYTSSDNGSSVLEFSSPQNSSGIGYFSLNNSRFHIFGHKDTLNKTPENYLTLDNDTLKVVNKKTKEFLCTIYQSGTDDPQTITSGTLEIGVTYEISFHNGSDDFTNVGAPNNSNHTKFIATGTTPLVWSSSSQLKYNNGYPKVKTIINEIGNIWIERSGIGSYNINSNNLFTEDKTFIYISPHKDEGNGVFPVMTFDITSESRIAIEVQDISSGFTDDIINKSILKIEVFN